MGPDKDKMSMQINPNLLKILLVIILLPLFLWLMDYLESLQSGWQKLSKIYKYTHRTDKGTIYASRWTRIGIMLYKYLNFDIGPDGLGIFIPTPVFKHPALFIPWNAFGKPRLKQRRLFKTVIIPIGDPQLTYIETSFLDYENLKGYLGEISKP